MTDFGIARALGQASLTDTGTVMGTAAYVAPEQARGEATTPSSDLYSLGILLFQMLTGSVPFDGDTPVAIAMRHLDEPVPLPSSRVADLPANLDEVVVRATAKSPADRYADADAMAAALRGPRDARRRRHPGPAGRRGDLGPRPRRRRRQPGVMPTVGVLPGGERTAVHPAPTRRTPRPRPRPRPSERRSTRTDARSAARRRRSGPSPVVWVLRAAVVALVAILAYVLLSGSDPADPARHRHAPAASSPTPPPAPPTTAPPADGSAVPAGLVGQQRDAAVSELIGLGVNVRWVLVRSTQPDGAVLGSFPAEGQPMAKGQTVALVVSRGHAPEKVNSSFVVPDGLVGTSA